jgi:hypothetical protein
MNVGVGIKGRAVSFLGIHKWDFWYSVQYGLVETAVHNELNEGIFQKQILNVNYSRRLTCRYSRQSFMANEYISGFGGADS